MLTLQPKIWTTLKSYSVSLFTSDLIAGLTVAMVAFPLSLAIAIASGASPAQGLVTACVAGFLISLFGGSRVQIGGPTGAFIVVVAGVIHNHGYDGLVLATLMAGMILLIAAFFKAGSLIRYIPEAVVSGFTIGIAIIIATSQLKDLFGLNAANPAEFLEKIEALWAARESFNLYAFGIGLLAMALIILFRRIAPKLPGLIFAVAMASALTLFLTLPVDTITSRFGALPSSLPMPALPVISFEKLEELLPSALIIAFLAGVESLLSAMVADQMIGSKHRSNAELLAQGIANIGSSLFGGLPATGAIARTATNVRAGGKTPMAGIFHALIVLLALIFASGIAGYMAMPALAALLIITAWNMSEPHKWKSYLKLPREDQLLLVLTLVLTVLVDLTVAIGLGVILGLAFRLRQREVPEADWKTPER